MSARAGSSQRRSVTTRDHVAHALLPPNLLVFHLTFNGLQRDIHVYMHCFTDDALSGLVVRLVLVKSAFSLISAILDMRV